MNNLSFSASSVLSVVKILVVLVLILVVYGKDEASYNKYYSKAIKGVLESPRTYEINGGKRKVIIDIETATEVIECGLDKRSSLDSVQQALFFHIITGKRPVVVIYDTDGKEGPIEYRIKKVCQLVGVSHIKATAKKWQI